MVEVGHAGGDEGGGDEEGHYEDGEAKDDGVGVCGEDDGVEEVGHRYRGGGVSGLDAALVRFFI